MTTQRSGTIARGTAWTVALFYLLIVFEFFYMATPFAVYFYGAYLLGLDALSRLPRLAWLTLFFLPHFAWTSSPLVNSASTVGSTLIVAGLLGFIVGAVQVYSRKLRKSGAAVGGLYRFVRHPQYASLILAGLGMLLLWPRFLMVVLFVTMFFIYSMLASIEERECLQKYGQAYADYRRQTPRFLPFAPHRTLSRPASSPSWSRRLGVAVLSYFATLLAALGIAFGLREYTIAHLFFSDSGKEMYIALLPLDRPTIQKLAVAARNDERLRTRLAESDGGPLVSYVMPWDWCVPEIPMSGMANHYAPRKFHSGRTKIVYTKALLPPGVTAHGNEILRNAIRTEPLAEVWLDENGEVAQVLGPPRETFYGRVPVPIF